MTPPESTARPRRTTAERSSGSLESRRARLLWQGTSVAPAHRHDIEGIDHVLERVDEVLHWLAHADAYAEHGARLEPGILFVGPPGTGKTLVARYIATTSGATFVAVRDFPLAGRSFEAADVRALFAHARRARRETDRPIVLFWDELDTIVARHGPFPPRPTDAAQQLLAELDGIHGKNDGVLFLAATNDAHDLPQALRRPGRIGVTIHFDAPSYDGKAALLEHYALRCHADPGLDYGRLARLLAAQSPAAAVEEVVRDAWRAAVRRAIDEQEPPMLTGRDLREALLDCRLGTRRPAASTSRLRVAVHEVGHALVALACGLPVAVVSVRPHGSRLGLTQTGGEIGPATVGELLGQLRVSFGGLAAEIEAGLGQGLGSTADIHHATELAASLVGEHGAGSRTRAFNATALGSTRTPSRSEPAVSEAALSLIDLDTIDLLHEARADTEAMIASIGRQTLLTLGELLAERDTMDGEEVTQAVLDALGRLPTPPA